MAIRNNRPFRPFAGAGNLLTNTFLGNKRKKTQTTAQAFDKTNKGSVIKAPKEAARTLTGEQGKTIKPMAGKVAKVQASQAVATPKTVTEPKSEAFNILAMEQANTALGLPAGGTTQTFSKGNVRAPQEPMRETASTATTQAIQSRPRVPRVPSVTSQRAALEQALLESMQPSDEEVALQTQLADLRAGAQEGAMAEEGAGRGRTLGLVRGRQEKLLGQAAVQEANLLDRLAIEQAKRTAANQAAQAQLQMAQQQEQLQAQRTAPIEFGGNLVRLNPATGQYETVLKGPQEAVDPLAQRKKELEIMKLEQDLMGGGDFNEQLSISELQDLGIPTNMFGITKGEAIQGLRSGGFGQTEAQEAQILALQDKVNLINDLTAEDSGIRGAVGAGPLSRGTLFRGKRQSDFLSGVDRLISQETIDQLIGLKERGGTLGALSENEARMLENAASKLGSWIIRDNQGNIKGVRTSEENFINELNRMKDLTNSAIERAGGQTPQSVLRNAGFDENEYQDLRNAGYSDRQIIETFGSFNNDLSTSQKGSVLDLGPITAYGSTAWKHGLDIDLAKGDPVPSPVNGVVEYVGPRGGFGNQVRVRDSQGNSHWLSHLDATNVQVGQQVAKGQPVGLGGNTGTTIPGKGGDGSHLDYTILLPNGQYLPPRQIEQFLRTS